MKVSLSVLVATTLALKGLAASSSPAAILKLEPYRKTVALRANVSGHAGLFVFDTAGGVSQFSPRFAERIGCKPWGRITGFQMMGQRLDMPQCSSVNVEISGHRWSLPVAGVFDVTSLFPKDAQPVDGLLALDLFAGNTISIDFPRKLLIVESEASLLTRVAGATEFPVRVSREAQGRALAVSIGVPSDHGRVWMELDSGNGGTILVSKPYASLFGLDPAKEGRQTVDFPLGAGFHAKGAAFTPDMIIDGNIGMPFLQSVVVTLDLPGGRLWLSHGEQGKQ
ncbi:MAG: hypothetical protein K2X03_11100 [Bryobacteraceae bacterium]|nr:hypothetical protein [Bryobacteraceae bacterium]